MFKEDDMHLLRNLIEIPSPSGYEKDIADFIKEYLLNRGVNHNQIEIDKHYNVIVNLNYEKEKTVLIDAHLDEIGFILSNVDRWGSISLQYLGGGDSTILSARHLNILTKNGIVPAVIDRKHAHLVYDEDMELNYSPENADIDIGSRDRDSILKNVKIGDPVVYQHNFRTLLNDYVSGYGFDDKAGCFLLMKTIEKIVKSKIKPSTNLVFVFSAQEEIGTKLIPVVRRINPNLIVEVDVTFATDYGSVDEIEREVGRCELSKGVSIIRGPGLDESCRELITKIAKARKIPYQNQIPTAGIYTSQTVAKDATNANAMVIGIPLRNMHSPTEIIHLDDLNSGRKLLTYFLQSKKLKEII